MPNRILKETIKSSAQIDALSWFEEVMFYRLLVSADDYGCLDGRVVLLKNELFPLKDNVTKKAVEDALNHLASIGLLCRYTVNGMPYLFFPTWEKHQRVRNQHRKYPQPPDDCHLTDNCQSNDGQLTADCLSESNPIQSESNPNPNPIPRKSADEVFERFWKAYPKKVGRKDAEKVFAKVPVPIETLLAAVDRQKRSAQWQRENGQFIPNPATWLRQGRWDDELPAAHDGASRDPDPEKIAQMQKMLKKMEGANG